MSSKQQITPFQIRNPYRLDRPHFDQAEVWQTIVAEEEDSQRAAQSTQRPLPPQPISKPLPENKRTKDYQLKQKSINEIASDYQESPVRRQSSNYFGQSWFSQSLQLRTSTPAPAKQQLPIPSITITHHIDTHAELTFERHVEWLTQTALWWDMPVVHLYPAPESSTALEYVETAASKFSSWVNFVKIPAGEEVCFGPDSLSNNTSQIKKGSASEKTSNTSNEDACFDGGFVTSNFKRVAGPREPTSSIGNTQTIDPIIGYVFVGSADEESQYNQVFETMKKAYPMIEIRYINSFEPVHLQSRQQRVLREEPCIYNLSWIHYWSAAKESQVLQSKIVNEVVRVRPMWVNGDYLHPNYTPTIPPTLASPPTTVESTVCNSTGAKLSTLSTLSDCEESEDQKIENYVKGNLSTASTTSQKDVCLTKSESSPRLGQSAVDNEYSERKRAGSQEQSKHISRTQSSIDIRQDDSESIKTAGRGYKRWNFGVLGKGSKSGGYRRSVSTPLLLLTKDESVTSMNLGIKKNNKSVDTLDRCQDNDANMSPPPLSPASLTSPTSTASTISSSSTLIGSLSLSSRLTGLAQRLGLSKMKGSSLMAVDI
ncbi:hypothetical protein BGZ76_009283 [Entomortierella beljakovae]|nr:hypothetical protein BGZ76_009283 [Entomortierella beljakovae]